MRDARAFEALHGDERLGRVLPPGPRLNGLTAMDLFHDNPLLSGRAPDARRVREVADARDRAKHDREESMPWDLMRSRAASA